MGLWKHISSYQEAFFQHVSFKIGNGCKVKFWKDKWLDNTSLQALYPSLYQIASNKECFVNQCRINNVWSPLFRRNFNDWELNDLFSLLSTLADYRTEELHSDKMVWGNSKEGQYTVKGNYYLMCSQNGLLNNWPWKHVWKIRLPPKVTCFTWLALNDAILTQDNLCKKKIVLVNRCYMCYQASENVNHLLMHCPVVADIWNCFLSFFGLHWVFPQSVKEAYSSWILWKVDKAIKRIWRMIPAIIFWCVWNERNRRCFDGVLTSNHSLKASCLVNLSCWNTLSPVNNVEIFLDFVSALTLA